MLGVEPVAPEVEPLVLVSVELLPVVPPVLPLPVEPEPLVPGAPMEELLLPVPLPVVPAVLPVLPVPEPAVPALPDGVVDGVVVELDELDPVVPSFLSQALSESAAATANVAIAI